MTKSDGLRGFVHLIRLVILFIGLTVQLKIVIAQVTIDQVNQAVQATKELCQDRITKDVVPGLAVAMVFQDQVVYAGGFGVRDVNSREPVNADTVFQLASLSKPLGSTVVAELVGEGKITWDSRISDLDPDFQMYDAWVTREVTIRDLYAHRSGLPDHAGDLLEDLGFDRAEVLHRLRYQKPDSSFRSRYAYTNFGLTEAAVAATKPYNISWEDAAEQKLYKPLGMNSTSSRFSDFIGRTNKALGHVKAAGKWVQKFKRDPDAQSPAGGVSSSVNDLAKWMRLQLANGRFEGKQIVDAKPLAETHSPQILTGFSPLSGLPSFYGLGWNVSYDEDGRLRLGHSGAFALGAGTAIALVPSEHLGVVVLTNAYPVGAAEAVVSTFIDVALHGKATQDWSAIFQKIFSNPAVLGTPQQADYSKPPVVPSPALATSAYVGTYTSDLYGEFQVIELGGGLALVEGPHSLTFALKHYDRDLFTYETEGENAVGATGVTFTIGADGKATSLVVEYLNSEGQGRFKRRPANQ
jgi:CubicO group peptidase (beta-lactamase class C family)